MSTTEELSVRSCKLLLGLAPDIAYAVSTLSRYSQNPGPNHWTAVKRVFRYLSGTKHLWLSFGGVADAGDGGLKGYADADGSMHEDRHTISGYAFLIGGGAVSWSSKRHDIISLSTTESEYVAAAHASKEALWLRQFIAQIFKPLTDPTTLFCDNQSAIALTPAITSITLEQNTLIFAFISYAGSPRRELSGLFTALPTRWLPTPSPKRSLPQR